jgi:hypothetical protein
MKKQAYKNSGLRLPGEASAKDKINSLQQQATAENNNDMPRQRGRRALRRSKDLLFLQIIPYRNTSGFLKQYPVTSSAEGRELLARMLELDRPVSEAVFLAVVLDDTYFEHLLVSRSIPVFLRALLDHPPGLHSSGAAG